MEKAGDQPPIAIQVIAKVQPSSWPSSPCDEELLMADLLSEAVKYDEMVDIGGEDQSPVVQKHQIKSNERGEASPSGGSSADDSSRSNNKLKLSAEAIEERRARHRAVQRRFVQRKKEATRRIKKLAADLEQQYRYLVLESEKNELIQENQMLQTQIQDNVPPVLLTVDPIHKMLEEKMEQVREFYQPLTEPEWTHVQRCNLHEYEVASQDPNYLTSGVKVMGWNDHRKIDNLSVKFVLSKEFPNARAVDLMTRTWERFMNPETHAGFFNPFLIIKMQILQVIDYNTLIIHRIIYNPQSQAISHSLDMLWRMRYGEDFIIFTCGLENNTAQRCIGGSHQWTQANGSLVFSPRPNQPQGYGCIFRHGGWIRHIVQGNVKYWLMEMFFMVLRFENIMVTPVFALPSE